ncbi:helix-turn-helix transcriptional regulator [Kitasatospora sp. CM 4170]|uniref:Helix-turn-helix transcriptional regulator n=1 Tax=Kitasatospora aburaviensis TaxID=67265 RepID=A0ABW1F5F6_9ACTN|nr:helix-turn-helix transcriptional regulator [Kitasatospora sp. CM 4170]WNM45560.1 helix-turn-helix transcriptional regulator [Kitasatospora sp. CM 4170]
MEQDWGRLGRAVREAREAAGLSQVELAESAGLSRSAVQSIERGRAFGSPQLSHRSVAQVLGWTPDSVALVLAGGEPARSAPSATAYQSTVSVVPSPDAESVDELLDDLTARVRAALLGGSVADADAIGLGEEPDDGEVVLIWKRGQRPDATPEQLRADLKKWARLQRVAREILADDNPST